MDQGIFVPKIKWETMKIAIISWTPIAGAPYQQWLCLKKYGREICPNLNVRFIQQRHRYQDGRVFPKDALFHETGIKGFIKNADVVHLHNYFPKELMSFVDKRRQRVICTLHSVPRQGTWKTAQLASHQTYSIRQHMQMREYDGFPTLPNMFDIWEWKPAPKRDFDVIKIIYCPSNKLPTEHRASKAYHDVMPVLGRLAQRSDIELIHFTNQEYRRNLELKRPGHIVIDDICGPHDTYHLTSLEGAAHAQAVLTSLKAKHGYPWIETNVATFERNLMALIDDRKKLYEHMKATRAWAEANWDPRVQVREFLKAYGAI